MFKNSIVSRKDDQGLPSVSVIVLNYNGREHLHPCFASLSRLDYPQERLELILVDNGSTDGSIGDMKANFPGVRIVRNEYNLGFARGNNIGAAEARGQYVAFLNNDMRVDPNWLIELVKPVLKQQDVVCTASKVLSWDGKKIDFVGGALNFYGHGFQLDYGKTNIDDYTQERPLLFACGGAMLIDKGVFLQCGGFDEDYFAFFEDVDLGWRLWILAYKVLFAPGSIVYHKGHSTARKVPDYRRRVLYERNALYTIIKNYEEENLQRILPAALLLTVKRALVHGRVNRSDYLLSAQGKRIRDTEKITKMGVSHLIALDEVMANLDSLLRKRQEIQRRRVRSDAEILPLFGKPFTPNCLDDGYLRTQSALEEAFGIRQLFLRDNRWCPEFVEGWDKEPTMQQVTIGNRVKVASSDDRKVLLISNDVIGEKMAGPGIRSWEFAKALSGNFQVSLAVPNKDHPAGNGFFVSSYTQDEGRLRELARAADVIVIQGFVLHFYPFLVKLSVALVVDVYDPFVLENIQIHSRERMLERERIHKTDLAVLNSQLRAGDFFLCASEKQRDFWLGMLLALNRVNPYTYESDETLRTLIDVVPFGLPSSPPEHTKQVLKGIYKTIGQDDKVMLWGGGIWDWFDPCTLIKAMANIAAHRDDVKLFFMGIKHPNPLIPRMQATGQAIQLSKNLGLYDKSVFFNDWVDYEDRQNYLLEADIGISLHLDHIETRLSFRTRILDYIWAGLPIITTKGDSMSELVERYNLGRVVDYEDVGQVTDTLMELLDTPNLRGGYGPGFEEVKGQFTWERAVEPLARFCANPRLAPDRPALGSRSQFASVDQSVARPTPWWALPGKAWYIFRRSGWDALRREAKSYLRWRFSA